MIQSLNSLDSYTSLRIGEKTYGCYSLKAAEKGLGSIAHLPCVLRMILETLLRNEDGTRVTVEQMRTLASYHALQKNQPVISFVPNRFAMDRGSALFLFADLACLVQAAAQRDKKRALFKDAPPLIVMEDGGKTDGSGPPPHALVAWARKIFPTVRTLSAPAPYEYGALFSCLAHGVALSAPPSADGGDSLAVPAIVVGPHDLCALMGSLGTLGWRIDALDVESYLLGYPPLWKIPPIIGIKITGAPRKGIAPTDIALTLVLLLRRADTRGKIVEFFGSGLDALSVADRALIALFVCKQEGASTVFFPPDLQMAKRLKSAGASDETLALIEAYAREQGLWRETGKETESKAPPAFNALVELSLDAVSPTVDYRTKQASILQLSEAATTFAKLPRPLANDDPLASLKHGDIVFANLGSPSMSLHPHELVAAALFSRQAKEKGLQIKPWVRVVMPPLSASLNAFMKENGLLAALEAFGIKPSAPEKGQPDLSATPLPENLLRLVAEKHLSIGSVGTDNAYADAAARQACAVHMTLSACAVLAYAIVGTLSCDINEKPLGLDVEGKPVFFKDLLPLGEKSAPTFAPLPFAPTEAEGPTATPTDAPAAEIVPFSWDQAGPLVERPTFLDGSAFRPEPKADLKDARILAQWGDNVQADGMASALSSFLTNGKKGDQAPLVLAAGERCGVGQGQEDAVRALLKAGVRAVIAQSYDPSFRLDLVRMGILPLQLKTGVSLADIHITNARNVHIIGIAELAETSANVMLVVETEDEVERFMLKCRLDTPDENAMFASGSLLAMAMRRLIPLEDAAVS